MRVPTLLVVLASVIACRAEERPPAAAAADPACFGSRVLSFQDLVAEVVIPPGQPCDSGSFIVFFTRGTDTIASLQEPREGTVGFIGTSDVNNDGRGEFWVATSSLKPEHTGILHAYMDSPDGVGRLPMAGLDSTQRAGYVGGDQYGLGADGRLVRAFARASGDTAWFAYDFRAAKWGPTTKPSWLR